VIPEGDEMDECAYNPETKQVYLKFERTMIVVDVEDFMDMLYTLEQTKAVIQEDPDVSLGEYEDEEGNVWQEFIVKDENEEYS
jgi:hypothetical protein